MDSEGFNDHLLILTLHVLSVELLVILFISL